MTLRHRGLIVGTKTDDGPWTMADGKTPKPSSDRAITLFFALCLLFSGCAYYSTSATGGAGIRTVAVPLLENESLEAGIHQALTDSLIQGFVVGGAMRVVREDQADAVVQGTVLEVREDPFTYGDRADQYQISVFVKMAFYDTRQKQVIWETERMRGYGIYDASTQRDHARQQGLGDALRMVAQDVVDRTQVGGW